MDRAHEESADRIRTDIQRGARDPAAFRAAILALPRQERDAWLDRVLELDELPDDEPLPSGCVPYLPASVDVLLRTVERSSMGSSDVVVDVGAGAGRAAAFFHLAAGASVIGLEIQRRLARASHDLATRLRLSQVSFVEGDAAELVSQMTAASIFFFYCPFSGERLATTLEKMEGIARTKTIRVCCVDLPLPPRDWLTREPPNAPDLAVYRSDALAAPSSAPWSVLRSSSALHGLLKK